MLFFESVLSKNLFFITCLNVFYNLIFLLYFQLKLYTFTIQLLDRLFEQPVLRGNRVLNFKL